MLSIETRAKAFRAGNVELKISKWSTWPYWLRGGMLFAIVFILWLCLGSYVDKMICIPTLIVACHQFASLPLSNHIKFCILKFLHLTLSFYILIFKFCILMLYGKIKNRKLSQLNASR